MNKTNEVWKDKMRSLLSEPENVVSPRGMEVRENIGEQYKVPMPAYIDLVERKVNQNFMFGEAAWVVEGSNKVSEIIPYMKRYAEFSDDGKFLRGAYGPKIIDQLGYVIDTIEKDNDTRQAVISTWRERPGPSKDIPCTVSMQFLLRDNKLDMVTTMRSQDIVLGFTYDVFTFSMVGKAAQTLLSERGTQVSLGDLTVNVGSLHLYKNHYNEVKEWLDNGKRDYSIENKVGRVMLSETYEELISNLKKETDNE